MSKRFRLTSPKLPRLSEADVVEACKRVVELHGYIPVRQHVGLYRSMDGERVLSLGKTGDPDWVCVKPPSFFMEVKRPGETPTEVQLKRHAELREAFKYDVVVVDSAELLFDWLQKRDRSP